MHLGDRLGLRLQGRVTILPRNSQLLRGSRSFLVVSQQDTDLSTPSALIYESVLNAVCPQPEAPFPAESDALVTRVVAV